MKIVNREEFLKLPSDTLFSLYTPSYFGEITIKGDTILPNDFRYQDINEAVDCRSSEEFSTILHSAQENGTSFKMDFQCWSRDGLYDNDQLYAVWDNDDVKALIVRLNKIIEK